MSLSNFIKFVLIVLIISESRAHAYTDPGSGALLWQLLVGAALGMLFYFRKITYWVRTRVNRVKNSPPVKGQASEGQDIGATGSK